MSAPDLRMVLAAEAENVGVVRHALAGIAEALGMEPARISDLKTVVTEACTNAVVHAYADRPGSMEVEARREDESLSILVRDQGTGIRPRADFDRQSLRMGLPLIAALSDSFEIGGGPGRGTVVVMRLGFRAEAQPPGREDASAERSPPAEGAAMSMRAGNLVGPVLSRVISSFAVKADFSVDRLSDAILLGDAVAAQGGDHFPDGTAHVSVNERDGTVFLRVGPLQDGAGQRLIQGMRIPQLDASLERLADEVRVETEETGEHLLLEISSREA